MKDQNKLLIFLFFLVSFLSYSFLIYSTTDNNNTVVSKETAEGKLLWQQYNCTSCHQFYGLGGHLGPDLTNVYSKRSRDYITAFLKYGTPVMPNFNLTEKEINSLLAFLKHTNASGIADPRTFILHKDGTINQ